MDRDYWPETELYAVEAQGCAHHPYRRQRGVLPATHPAVHPLLQASSRYESSIVRNGNGNKAEPELPGRKAKPYLDSPI